MRSSIAGGPYGLRGRVLTARFATAREDFGASIWPSNCNRRVCSDSEPPIGEDLEDRGDRTRVGHGRQLLIGLRAMG